MKKLMEKLFSKWKNVLAFAQRLLSKIILHF